MLKHVFPTLGRTIPGSRTAAPVAVDPVLGFENGMVKRNSLTKLTAVDRQKSRTPA